MGYANKIAAIRHEIARASDATDWFLDLCDLADELTDLTFDDHDPNLRYAATLVGDAAQDAMSDTADAVALLTRAAEALAR